jgi:hypothetical protein
MIVARGSIQPITVMELVPITSIVINIFAHTLLLAILGP